MKNHSDTNTTALAWTLLIAGISTICSLIGAMFLSVLDKRREKFTRKHFEQNPKVRF